MITFNMFVECLAVAYQVYNATDDSDEECFICLTLDFNESEEETRLREILCKILGESFGVTISDCKPYIERLHHTINQREEESLKVFIDYLATMYDTKLYPSDWSYSRVANRLRERWLFDLSKSA